VGSIPVCDKNGKFLLPADKTGYQKNDGYWALRSRLAVIFFEHAESLGVDLRVGPDTAVARYFETKDEAGVETANGEQFTADCVICCDGISSKGRELICGDDSAVIPTSQYVFRTSFHTAELMKDPENQWIMEGTEDSGKVFAGWGLEFGFVSFANGQEMALAGIYNVRKQNLALCFLLSSRFTFLINLIGRFC
jgi:2-polyprenyl-6-methoxyphenol hydroxylase-like FAD-dependent oxidoreductase